MECPFSRFEIENIGIQTVRMQYLSFIMGLHHGEDGGFSVILNEISTGIPVFQGLLLAVHHAACNHDQGIPRLVAGLADQVP